MVKKLYQVDAFTDEAFKGNPAGVCLLTEPVPDAWMQALAAEMNLSETAFLMPENDGWRLRWFTPTTEVDLCGHATLASVYVLFNNQSAITGEVLKFFTRSGTLTARWADEMVELDFPAMVPQEMTVPHKISEILGFRPTSAVFSGDYYLFEAENAQTVSSSAPDFAKLVQLPMPEVIITARSSSQDYDFISRFFAPRLGIDEDPVTGSAHCLLAPYWGRKLSKSKMRAYQASRRGGSLGLDWMGDRVYITGKAKMVFEGVVLVD